MQERRVREKSNAQYFYTGSLKLELHPVCQGNPSLTLHYFKYLQSLHPYTFKICKNTQKTLESHQHNKTPLADLKNH